MTGFNRVRLLMTLVALSGAAAATAMGPPGEGPRPFPIERFAAKIGLSEGQIKAFRDLEDRTLKTALEARGRVAFLEHEVQRMIRDEAPDRDAIFAKVDEIATLRAQQRKLAIGARLEGRALLTPEQREKLEALLLAGRAMREGGRRDWRHPPHEAAGDGPGDDEELTSEAPAPLDF